MALVSDLKETTSSTLKIGAGTLTVPADASVSNTNTGDNATNSQYSGLVTNATHTGDVTGATALTIANKVTMTATAPITVSGTPTVIAGSAVAFAISAATASVNGYATAAQITKLDGIAVGATAVVVEDSAVDGHTTQAISSNALFDHNAIAATASVQGHATAAQITKLDGIAAGATNTPLTTKIDDFGICGTSDTTKNANTTNHGLLLKAVAPAAGLTSFPAIENGETVYKLKALFDATDPSTQAFSDAAAVGTAVTSARRDHKHAMMAAPTSVSGNAGTVTAAAETGDTSCSVALVTDVSGSLPLKTNTNLTFNASTGVLTSASAVLTTADINGGTADNVVIGGSTAAAITGTTITANTGLMPDANDGAYLGQAGTAFSDLFLAEGGVINWDSSDLTLTQTGNDLTLAGGVFTSEIGTVTQNKMRGWMAEVYKTASSDSTLTAAECSKTIVSNYGMTDADCIIDLPTAAEGLSFICILPAVRARYFRLRCPSAQADKIYLLGVAGSDDGYVGVASGYVTGASCQMFTFKASDGGYDWFCIPIFGTWVAG